MGEVRFEIAPGNTKVSPYMPSAHVRTITQHLVKKYKKSIILLLGLHPYGIFFCQFIIIIESCSTSSKATIKLRMQVAQEEMNIRLFHAVARGDLTRIKTLIEAGADCSARDYNGSTCLHLAVSRNLVDVVKYFIELGAVLDTVEQHNEIQIKSLQTNRKSQTNTNVCLPSLRGRAPIAELRRSNSEFAIISHFPDNIAKAMISGAPTVEISKKDVSILFSNIVEYSALRGTLSPPVLFDMLDRLFQTFDQLAALHGVQRVDAVDGCYIAAANFSRTQPADHAVILARFAVAAMAAAASTIIDPAQPELGVVRLLAGAHVGVVWGGLIGTHGGRKHTLLGDAVNVASRMESHGMPGAIQCSAAFAAALERQGRPGDGLRLEPRVGGVELKGRGWMGTFWLEAAKTETVEDSVHTAEEHPTGPVSGSPSDQGGALLWTAGQGPGRPAQSDTDPPADSRAS